MLNAHDWGPKQIHQSEERQKWKCFIWNESSIKKHEKGVVNLGSEKAKATNVLLVEYLKHNLLVSAKCVIKDTLLHLILENVKSKK